MKMKMNKTILVMLIILIIGAILLIYGIISGIFFDGGLFAGTAIGLGISWVVLSLIFIGIHIFKPDYIRQKEIENKDERLIRIREKAAYVANIGLIFEYIAAKIILLIFFDDLYFASMSLSIFVIVYLIIYLIALFINKKRM